MTGMRRGELAGLCWRCLDLDGARLSVQQQLVPTRGGCTFGPPKSARSRRTIAIDTETVDVLREHRQTRLLERDFAGDAYTDLDLVFADQLGGRIHPQRLTEWFGKHRKAADIPVGTLKTLRHTHATLALTSGIPLISSRQDSATIRRPCSIPTRTCYRARMSRPPSGWRR